MIPFPAKKYNVIYADPPWGYQNKATRAAADKHYGTMTIDDLKQMPVNSITAGDGCALFMWATFPMLREALELIEAWGFEYKTIAFCWVKQNKNSDGIFMGEAKQEQRRNFQRHGLLYPVKRGDLSACHPRPSSGTQVQIRLVRDYKPHRTAQQKAGGNPRPHR